MRSICTSSVSTAKMDTSPTTDTHSIASIAVKHPIFLCCLINLPFKESEIFEEVNAGGIPPKERSDLSALYFNNKIFVFGAEQLHSLPT